MSVASLATFDTDRQPQPPFIRVAIDVLIGGERGRFVISLFVNDMPITTKVFLSKINETFTANVTRIIKRFAIQFESPAEKALDTAAPAPSERDDPLFAHVAPMLVSTVRCPDSSDFFITLAPMAHVDVVSGYPQVVFGAVTAGRDVVRMIEDVDVDAFTAPTAAVKIVSASVLADGDDGGVPVDSVDSADAFPAAPDDFGDQTVAALCVAAEAIKALANSAYRRGELAVALHKYHQALRYVSYEQFLSPSERSAVDNLSATLHSNIAAAHAKLADWEQVHTHCRRALDFDRTHRKATLRLATALLKLGRDEDAVTALQAAMDNGHSADQQMRRALAKCLQSIRERDAQIAPQYQRMFTANTMS